MKINKEQRDKLRDIGRQYGLKLLLLHGSYATGKERPGSDLDIAYLPDKPLNYQQQLNLHSDLAGIFGDNSERELDIKSLSKADPFFRYEVSRDSRLLFGDRTVYDEFRTDAFARYQDARPLFQLERLLSRRLLASLLQ